MDRMTRIRLALLAAAAVATLAALSGCGPDKKPAAAAPPSSDPSSSSSSAAPSSDPSSAPSSSSSSSPKASSSAAAGKQCTSAAIKLAPVPGSENGAAGTIYVQIGLTNTAKTSCTVKGYPDFTLTARSPSTQRDTQLAAPIERDTNLVAPYGGTPTTVTIQPGGKAVFLLGYSQVPRGETACPVADKMHLRLPTQPTPVVAAVSIKVCGPALRVSKLVPSP